MKNNIWRSSGSKYAEFVLSQDRIIDVNANLDYQVSQKARLFEKVRSYVKLFSKTRRSKVIYAKHI